MRINTIEIINYRQYKHVKYTFNKKTEYDLHIIKGKNGMGKTNLLNAITWCLYNKEPHLGIKNSGKPRINIVELNEARAKGEELCKVCVRITISDNNTSIIFERKQSFSTDNTLFEYKPEFTITCIDPNGETKVFDDNDTTNSYVNQYMPQDIREYFFFDGEHLEKYFINEQGEKIEEAIHVISQVKLLSSMKERLKSIIDDFNCEAGKKNKNISGLIEEKNKIEKDIKTKNEEINKLKKQISISKKIIDECKEFLKGKEGLPNKEKEFNEIMEEIRDRNSEKQNLDNKISKFIIRYKTLFSFYPAIKQTYELICERESGGAFPPAIDKDFLKAMLSNHKCLVCDRELSDKESLHILELLNELSIANRPSHILYGIKSELENLIEETREYKNIRDNLMNRRISLEKTIEKLDKRLNELDAELKQFTDKEKVREMHEKRMHNLELLEMNERKKVQYEIDNENLVSKLKNINIQLEKDRKSNEEFKELNEKIDFSNEAREIVADIEKEMMDEVREKIKDETMMIFEALEWKKESFSHINLDEKYNLELYDKDGYPSVGTCSAGERALLALSFTLALQKVAGYDSMLFIDTPVGRIDTENRTNFANVLKNISMNKQVIITLTTSEYSEEIQKVFELIKSSFVELETIDEKITMLREE